MNIGICGGGTMGAGIAYTCLLAGHSVTVYDALPAAEARCSNFLQQQLAKAVARNVLAENDAADVLARYQFVAAVEALAQSELVIEAIIEDKSAKHQLFQAIEPHLSAEAILASNTSSVSITALAAVLSKPERFVGLHFFNPAHLMKLVEIIRGVKTSPDIVEAVIAFTRGLGKTPVLARDVPGFIVNRVARNFYLESMRLAQEGTASIECIDKLMRAAGFKMGPFELVDLIGVDTNYAVSVSVWEQYFYEPRFAPALLQRQYVEAGLHGRKTGEGFYKYDATS
jgi:3-hydroxybutyryl-CoA dehydrogenase